MNIGKASNLSRLSVKTVRYYSDIGIVKPEINVSNGYREYSRNDVEMLKFVGKARKFNFSILECRELLSLYKNKKRTSKKVKTMTLEKINEINEKIEELKILRSQLSNLANNCRGDEEPHCPILNEFAKK